MASFFVFPKKVMGRGLSSEIPKVLGKAYSVQRAMGSTGRVPCYVQPSTQPLKHIARTW